MKNLHTVITFTLINLIFIIGLTYFFGVVKSESKTAGVTGIISPVIENTPSKDSHSPEINISKIPVRASSGRNPGENTQNSNPSPQSAEIIAQDTPTPIPAPTEDPNLCIISVDGQRYNVTQFRKIHGGGDIFICGTDMSAAFHNQHPAGYLEKMTQYRI